MAAGLSRRMGCPKLMLPYQGKPLIRHVIEKAYFSRLDGVVVVINPEHEAMAKEVCNKMVNQVVLNHGAYVGMSTSLILGLKALPEEAKAAMILLGDQPQMSSEVINDVVERFHTTAAPILQTSFQGTKGHPVVFTREMFPFLYEIKGDQGGKEVIRKFSEQVEWMEVDSVFVQDIDTRCDYNRLIGKEANE